MLHFDICYVLLTSQVLLTGSKEMNEIMTQISVITVNINVYNTIWSFLCTYFLLQPDDGLMIMKPKHAAAIVMTATYNKQLFDRLYGCVY